jgi:hypothetical protein
VILIVCVGGQVRCGNQKREGNKQDFGP